MCRSKDLRYASPLHESRETQQIRLKPDPTDEPTTLYELGKPEACLLRPQPGQITAAGALISSCLGPIERRSIGPRALGDQIRSIDKTRLRERIGRLDRDEMIRIDDALRITLALSFP